MKNETQQHLLTIKSFIDKAVKAGKVFSSADEVMQVINSYNTIVSTIEQTSVTSKTE